MNREEREQLIAENAAATARIIDDAASRRYEFEMKALDGVYDEPPPQPAIVRKAYTQPTQQQDWSKWDDWCKAHIRNAAEENAGMVIDALVEYVKEEFAKRDRELAALRAELTITGALARCEVSELRKKSDVA